MAETLLTWYVGDRSPSISQLVAIDEEPVDLLDVGATVAFNMRLAGSTEDSVEGVAVIVEDESGEAADRGMVRYDWADDDLAEAGTFIGRWPVTIGGKVQTVAESVIQVLEPALASHGYVELEPVKRSIGIRTGDQDIDVLRVIRAASRAVERHCRRPRFWANPADEIRVFTTDDPCVVGAGDMVSVSAVKTLGADDSYSVVWAASDWRFDPPNAALDDLPYRSVETTRAGVYRFPTVRNGVQVTGKFGWPSVPAEIEEATVILASRYYQRRSAALGVMAVSSDGVSIRISRQDPDVVELLSPFVVDAVSSPRLG